MYGWFGIYGTENFPDWCYVHFDPWLLGSILLGIMLFIALLALLATLLYIVCYKRKDEILIEERPSAPCRPELKTCGPCQPRLTTPCAGNHSTSTPACVTGRCGVTTKLGCGSGPCGLHNRSTFVL